MKKTHILKRSFAVLLSVLLILSVVPLAGLSDLLPKFDFGVTASAEGSSACDTEGHSFTGWRYGDGVYYRDCNVCGYRETKSRADMETTWSWSKTAYSNGILVMDWCSVNALTSASAQFYVRFTQTSSNYNVTASETGYYWGTSENNLVKQSAKQTNTIVNTQKITGLTPDTVYYFKVYYIYNGVEYQSNVGWLKTNVDPTNKYSQNDTAVSNGEFHIHQARFITQTSALLSAQIAIDQRYVRHIYGTGLKIGTSESNMVEYIQNNSGNADGEETQAFGVGFQIGDGANDYVGKLTCNTKYYYQLFYFTNAARTERKTSKINWFITEDHVYGAWIDDENGTSHTKYCAVDSSHSVTDFHHFGDWDLVAEDTCTTPRVEQRVCADCGYTETRDYPVPGHNWGEWTDNGDGTHTRVCKRDASHVETDSHVFLLASVKDPTCLTPGERVSFCCECDATKTETIPALEHSQNYQKGNMLSFGSYPQSRVTDEALLTQLNMCDLTWTVVDTDPKTPEATLEKEIFKYADVMLNGEKYRAIQMLTADDYYDYAYSEDDGVVWFRFEPIQWVVADPETGLIVSRNILDAVPFDDVHTQKAESGLDDFSAVVLNWETSYLREWLNDDFYHLAFSDAEKEQILSSTVSTASINDDTAVDTTDYIFILSEAEFDQYHTHKPDQYYKEYMFKELTNQEDHVEKYLDMWGVPATDYAAVGSYLVGANWNEDGIDYQASYYDFRTRNFTTAEEEVITMVLGTVPAMRIELPTNEVTEIAPTCTESGATAEISCMNCGTVITPSEVISALGHDWGEWTDNGDGQHIRVCKRVSSHTETAVHVWNDGVVTKEPTCKETGTELFTCTVCDATKTEPIAIDSNNHANYGTHIENAAAATCTEAGYTGDTVCSGCGATLTAGEAIDPLGHDWGNWTDNGDGQHIRVCKRVSSHTETAVHVWNDGVVTKEPTCKETGTKLFTCTVCDATKTEPIAINSNNHANYGTHIENAAAATCTDAGYTGDTVCSGCGATLTAGEAIDPLGHDWGDWTETKAATETECGEETRVCNRVASHKETRPTPVLTPDSKDNESIQTEKTATYDATNSEATISLSAESKGQTIRTKTTTLLDIVLVLDQSGSMGYQMNSETRPSDVSKNRKAKLKEAVNAFVAQMAQDNSGHRISIVGFAMGNSSGKGTDEYGRTRTLNAYDNTNILTVPNGNPVKFDPTPSSIPTMNEVYRQSLVSVSVNGNVNPIITNAINSIDACGATAADLGLLMACKVFEQNPNVDGRKRVVVFMTDGEPTYASAFSDAVAEYAKSNATLLKNAYGADVYSVGVVGTGISQKCENFLKAVATDSTYYYKVTDGASFLNSFKDIAEESVKVETAFDDVTLVDTVTKEFTLTKTQEQALRLSAIEMLGVTDEDVAVDRFADGTTRIRIAHIHPKTEQRGEDTYFTIDFSFTVSANENALTYADYVTNTENSGIMIGDESVYEQCFQPASVTTEAADGVICFKLNGEPFHIVRFHAGDAVTTPTLTLEGTHTFSGWTIPEPLIFTNGKIEIEATLTQPQYTVTWMIDGTQIEEQYEEGAILTAPQVGPSGNGKMFQGWTPDVPEVMPAQNLTFTAQFAAHTHSYEAYVVQAASCGVAGIRRFVCACGDSYEETIPGNTHVWTTFATDATNNTGNFAYVVCENCGATQTVSFSYQLEAPGSKMQTYELSLMDLNNAKVQPQDGSITITLQIPAEMRNARDIYVYRIEADGSKTDLHADKSWNNLKFTTDHFSPYVLEAVYDCETTGNHAWNDGTVTKNSTCNAQGEKTFICTDCGAEKTEPIPINSSAHSMTYVPAKNATTEAEGNVAYYHCSVCGKNFADQNGTQELTKVTTDKLPKQDEPQKNYNDCKYCGEKHTGAFGWLIKLIHSILAAFGMRK